MKKEVSQWSTKERTLSYQYEQELAKKRKEEQAKVQGHNAHTSEEEKEIEAVAELKRVEERMKVLSKAVKFKEDLKDLSNGKIVKQIGEETANLKSAKEAVRALVGKRGIKKGYEEVKKGGGLSPKSSPRR
ncbi:hypothetical protein TeGR_g2226 [Tetraparma gracilis]|uniref:Uncharacterized protein n=1 Tax=Tetraparma gracilis TaxID=2962635 RepID=A0ABQ6MC11_9STRA|nr:hypothetical protein TeGR_g2226 [Tetraparma gracilis]